MGTQQTMKAIEIAASGELQIGERPRPIPAEGEVLIKVKAAGMNRADLLQLQGHHPPPAGASDILGLEVSGVVDAVGPGISDAMIGEKVCALLEGGGYAEYATAKVTQCLPVSGELDLIKAAGLPEALFTVTKNVFMIGQLRADDHLLIHGGASGIGTLAIQMAKSVGAFVTVTAGTDEKCDLCRDLGADLALNYKEADVAEALKDNGVDVVLDMAGGKTLTRTLPIMNKYGRYVNIAYMENVKAEIDISTIMKKQLTLTGSTLRHDIAEFKESYAEMIHEIFWQDILEGKIKPVIHKTWPLSDAVLAHQSFATGDHAGKMLLVI